MGEPAGLVVAILSIGDMGLGISKILISQKYRVVTFAEDRSFRGAAEFVISQAKGTPQAFSRLSFNADAHASEGTKERARVSGVELVPSITELVKQSDCLLSIVPPRDALATAQRVFDATPQGMNTRERPLYYLDLNAIAPGLASQTQCLFEKNHNIVLIDGGIIGGVPYPRAESATGWNSPSLIVSGPTKLPYANLLRVLNIDHMSEQIGAASGLKMCFASTTKGFYALAIQSYVTADALGVLPQLRQYMETYNADTLKIADKGVTGMPPKAYRWVNEMQQIGIMMKENGAFGSELFDGVAEVYRVVAEDTVLGQEQPRKRTRTTVDEIVGAMRSGMADKAKQP